MSTFRFESPFALLLCIPVLAVVCVTAFRRRSAVLYSSVAILKDLPVTLRQRLKRLLPWLRLFGLLLIVVCHAVLQRFAESVGISMSIRWTFLLPPN